MLLCDHAYIFQNPEKWLRKRGEAVSEYAPAFNPVLLQTLALIATAIECALQNYIKGFKEMQQGVNDSTLATHTEIFSKLHITASWEDALLMEENNNYFRDFDLNANMAQGTDTEIKTKSIMQIHNAKENLCRMKAEKYNSFLALVHNSGYRAVTWRIYAPFDKNGLTDLYHTWIKYYAANQDGVGAGMVTVGAGAGAFLV
ncbi:hypothetical protein M405DRAFT_847110, partial [Rhizopogon salebrosus TDB-379]